MKAAYGKKHQDRKKRMETMDRFMSVYAGISVVVLHELWGFGEGRCVKYMNSLNVIMNEGLEQYRECGDTERIEAVGNLYWASRRDLADMGVEIEKIDKQFAPYYPDGWKWTSYSRGNPVERKAYLNSVDESVAQIWYLTALYLRDTYGFGKIKLTRYYTRCREKYAVFWTEYLKCSVAGDLFCTKYLDDLKEKCLAMGVGI